MIYVLIIMAYGGADGGRAIDTSQHFLSRAECQQAAADIVAGSRDRFPPSAVCIKRTITSVVGSPTGERT